MPVIELSNDEEITLTAKAADAGFSLKDWLKHLAASEPLVSTPVGPASVEKPAPRRHISEVIRDRMSKVPREAFAEIPTDWASESDHYIYGTPKKNL